MNSICIQYRFFASLETRAAFVTVIYGCDFFLLWFLIKSEVSWIVLWYYISNNNVLGHIPLWECPFRAFKTSSDCSIIFFFRQCFTVAAFSVLISFVVLWFLFLVRGGGSTSVLLYSAINWLISYVTNYSLILARNFSVNL